MITPDIIEGMVSTLLVKSYDEPVPIPDLHREIWNLCCLPDKKVAIAAPRGHAKSTCVSHAFVLSKVLFREARYVLIISNIESVASNFLAGIKKELQENKDLIELFKIRRFVKDAVTDIIVECTDGRKFRITALGAEQKVRGRLWEGTRPDLIICDDFEEDEMVESNDRREKFRNWFFKALVPALSRKGRIIVIGTILHMDSLLFRLMKNKSWTSKLYKAHKGFDDFSNILWPDMWPEERLRSERDEKINEGCPEAYSQEMLNDPIDQSDAFFRREDFIPMEDGSKEVPKNYYAAIDFAISDQDKADYTAIVVGGMDEVGLLYIVDVLRFRGDTEEIISQMLATQIKWRVEGWKAEDGAIRKALEGELYRRMLDGNTILNISTGVPTKDKRTRARAIQGRVRAGGVRFDKEASWYPIFEEELLQFPKGAKKDQVDAFAWLGIALNELTPAMSREEFEEEEWENEYGSFVSGGESWVTGY